MRRVAQLDTVDRAIGRIPLAQQLPRRHVVDGHSTQAASLLQHAQHQARIVGLGINVAQAVLQIGATNIGC